MEDRIVVKLTSQSDLSAAQLDLQEIVERAQDLEEEYGVLNSRMRDAAKTAGRGSDEYKELNRQAQLNRKSINELTKGVKLTNLSMNALRARADNLRESLNNTSRAANPRQYKELQAQLKETENAMERLDKKSLKDTAISELKMGTLGALSSAYYSLKYAIQGGLGTIVDFEQANATLAAILGKSQSEITALTEDAQRLGAITAYTASQMTELQTELAKLGFTENEILDATESVQRFATATGADLASAASLAGASLRAFGLEAKDMERAVSTMAVATTKSALDFGALDTAMSNIAPVAKSFGFTIEDTTALLGTLANSGFDASSAATATRNILLNLADSNGKLAKALGQPVKSMDDLIPALKGLQERGIDLGEALELTNKQSVSAFNTFLSGVDSLESLREGITDASDAFKMMESERLNSVEGSTKLLQSAWEGLMLQFYDSRGAFKDIVDLAAQIVGSLQNGVKWIQENSDSIKVFLGVLLSSLAAGKLTIALINTEWAALKARTVARWAEIKAMGAAKVANEALKKSLLTSHWGLIAIAITAAVAGLAIWIKHANKASAEQKALNEAQERFVELQSENTASVKAEQQSLNSLVNAIIKTTNNEKLRGDLIDRLQKDYPDFLGNIEKEKVTNGLLEGILYNVNTEYEKRIDLMNKQAKSQAYNETLVDLNKQLIQQEQELAKETKTKKQDKLRKEIEQTQAAIEALNTALLKADEDTKKAEDDLKNFNSLENVEKRMATLRTTIADKQAMANKATTEEERKFYEKQADDLVNALNALQVQYDSKKAEADKKRDEGNKNDIKAEREKAKKLREVRLQEEKNKLAEKQLKDPVTDEDYKAQVEQAKKVAELEAQVQIDALDKANMSAREYAAQKKAIELELQKNLAQIDKNEEDRKFNAKKEQQERLLELDVAFAQQEVDALTGAESVEAQKRAYNELYNAKKDQLEKQAQLEVDAISRSTDTEEVKKAKIEAINQQLNADLVNLKKENNTNLLAVDEQYVSELQRTLTRAQDAVDQSYGLNKLDTLQQRYDAEITLYDEQQRLLNSKYDEGLITYQEFKDQELEIERNANAASMTLQQEKMQVIMDGFQMALQQMQAFADVAFDMIGSQIQAEMDALDEEYTTDAEEAAKNSNKKLITEEEYEKKKAALQLKQQKLAKAQALFTAGINTAMAITSALATQPFVPLGLAMAVLAGALGAAQIAAIAAKPLSQYAKGRKGGEGEYALVGELGPEIMYIPKGASIVPNNKIGDQNAWYDYGVPRLAIPELPSTTHMTTSYTEQQIVPFIDYDRLGQSVAENMPETKHVSVNIDRDGIFVQDGNYTSRHLNRKYTGTWN